MFSFLLNKLKTSGHPILLFSEIDEEMIKRYNILNFLKKKNHGIKKLYKKFSVDRVFYSFIKVEIRKKRYENTIKKSRNIFSSLGVKNSIFLFSKLFYNYFNSYKGKIIKKKSKKKIMNDVSRFFFKKNFCFSSCFLEGENGIATGSIDGKIEIYNSYKKVPLFSVKVPFFPVSNLCNSSNFTNIFLSAHNNQIKIWKISSHSNFLQIFSFWNKNIITFSNFRKDKNLIDFFLSENIWKSFDLESQRLVSEQTFTEKIFCIENERLNNLLAIGSRSAIIIFDTRIGKNVIRIKSQENFLMSLKWFSNNYQILCSGDKNFGTIWDIRKYQSCQKCMNHRMSISSLAFTSSSRFVISSSFDKTTKIWAKKDFSFYKSYSDRKKIIKNLISPCSLFFSTLNIHSELKLFLC